MTVNYHGIEFGMTGLNLESLRFNVWMMNTISNKESRSINIQGYAEA